MPHHLLPGFSTVQLRNEAKPRNREKTTWERTSIQTLLRNASSGRYFGRWTIGGKQIWRKLDPDLFSVAKLRLAEQASRTEDCTLRSGGHPWQRNHRRPNQGASGARAEPGDPKPSSITARTVALKELTKTWPGIAELKPRPNHAGRSPSVGRPLQRRSPQFCASGGKDSHQLPTFGLPSPTTLFYDWDIRTSRPSQPTTALRDSACGKGGTEAGTILAKQTSTFCVAVSSRRRTVGRVSSRLSFPHSMAPGPAAALTWSKHRGGYSHLTRKGVSFD